MTSSSGEPLERAIGVGEAAALLGVSPDTVYTYARSGEIPAFKVGRVWRFWPSEIRSAMARPAPDPWAMPPASRRARRM